MRHFNFLRTAILAASLLAPLGGVGTAFADTAVTRQTEQQLQQPSNDSPYDAPGFVIDESNIHS